MALSDHSGAGLTRDPVLRQPVLSTSIECSPAAHRHRVDGGGLRESSRGSSVCGHDGDGFKHYVQLIMEDIMQHGPGNAFRLRHMLEDRLLRAGELAVLRREHSLEGPPESHA
ncbi:hypothetical protein PF005_g5289 [Phytophthora fragariae]|uniref:Uncharacterized protein n=1 Tax=Phytophthora fragariae TaxID=53985 RepID=A0A6A3Z068_9STRA|nr:hypothetical protein PF007_g4134 [Phytophthora fragariae]KAE9132166.1 hypothetical protein PF010_g3270 [Phytophthora fragariae]KAE9226016.1 hypothetical protein PF005_g5289 [Phytophthora fragariae]